MPVGVFCLTFLIFAGHSLAQSPIEIQTRDGRILRVESVRMRAGLFILSSRGLPTIELKPSEIACFGPPCIEDAPREPAASKAAPKTEAAPKTTPGHIAFRGSRTVISNLLPKLLDAYAATLPTGASQPHYDRMLGRSFTLLTSIGAPVATIDLYPGEATAAFEGLLADKAAIGVSARPLGSEETRALLERHSVDMSSPDSERIIALDAVAVIVNPANPARNLAFTTGTLAEIFSGGVADWSRVGGVPGQITAYMPDTKSAPFEAFSDLVMRPSGVVVSGAVQRGGSSTDVSRAVAEDVNAIGVVDLHAIGGNQGLAVKNACGIGHRPTPHSVKAETYPLARRVYVYTAGAPADPAARRIVDFVVSPAAQSAVRAAGYVDQEIVFEDAAQRAHWIGSITARANPGTPASAIAGMIADARAMRRSSISLRFAPDSVEFDTKARADLARIADLIKSAQVSGRRWALVGFADASTAYSSNFGLSQRRAAAAAQELANLGIHVDKSNIIARSWLNPDACRADDEGRRMFDRRVEFWVEENAPLTSVETGAAESVER